MRKFLTGLGLAVLVAGQGITAAPAVAASSIELSAAQVLQPFAAAAAAKTADARSATAKVANDVRQALDSGQRPDILVQFHGKADLRGADRLPAGARAAFVHRKLSSFADGAQAPARSTLQGFGRQPSSLSDDSGYMVLWLTNSIAVAAASEAEIDALAATPGVAKIVQQQVIPPQPEIEPEAIPSFALDAVEASIAQIKAPDVWALGFEGQGITVGNVDSGVRHTHQALVNQYRGNSGSGFDHNYNWFDPYSFSTAPRNTGSHGTHTMGTMVGDDGGANQVGVAPGAKWVACIGFGGAGGGATDAGLIACNQWMVAPTDLNGNNPNPALAAHVSNNSWGSTICDGAYDTWYESAVDGLIAAGVVPVWSMGNASNCGLPNNPPLGQNSSPSNYGKVLSVGSTGNSNGTYAPHSIKGPTQNPSLGLPDYMDHFGFADLKPNVVAPGVSIRSTISSSDTAYGLSNGTSMSAPAVAGMIALMWNAAPCLIGDYATTGSLVMSTATAIPVATGSPSDGPGNVPNQATGWGEVNALAAVDAAIAHCAVVGGPDPVILVSPAQINLTLFQGDAGDSSLIIRNVAGGTLEWSVAETATAGSCGSPTPVSWLSLAPASGSTAAGMTSQVAVSVDAGALEIGSYSATVCVSSNDSTGDTLVEVPVNLTVADPDVFPLPYCEVSVTNDVEPISRVVFAGIDNSSSPAVNGSPAHEDFRSVVGNVETDASYLMRVEGNTAGSFTTHVVAFFDWNRDGDFGDAGESRVIGTIANSTGTDGIFASASVLIPADVTSGPVRMRISKQFNSAPTACGPISWGQAEDYTIQVTQVAPEIELAPASLSFDTTIGGSESQDLSISNIGTGTLSWSIATADANRTPAPRIGGALAGAVEFGAGERVRQPFVVQPMADCAVVPGQIVHDDGSVENGYSGNPDVVSQLRLVDRFTPAIYPALVTSVCVSFISQGPTTLNYNVVVYDDDGAGGSPGTRLAAVAATATGIPVIAGLPTTPSFYTVDLSGLGLSVEAGSVYIGVEYAPVPGGQNIFVSSDQSTTNPVGYAGGYFYTDNAGAWGPIEASYPSYRSLMVRAALPPSDPEGCDIPANIPWLSVSPGSGTVAEGQATTTSVSVDASGMAPGVYDALLCVSSNDRGNPLIEYPVELRVRPTTLGANITVDPAALTATLGDTQVIERSIAIGNTGSATLDWAIGDDLLRAPGGIPLYVQEGNPGSGGVLSIEDLSGPAYSTQAADDFVVPAGALWVVDRVVAAGIYDGLVNPAAAVNVSFHADDGGMPGAVIAGFDALVPTEDNDGVLTIDLPQGVSLEEGSWWLSVQPAMDFFADGSWNWQTQSVSSGAEFHWQNPGGGYGGVCTEWAPGTSCGVSTDTDLTFALYGAGADSGSCALPGWIEIDPLSGSVASGQTDVATVTLDSTGLADGIYSAAVCIDSNDPANPRVVVPVNITVDNAIQQPVIEVAPAELAFELAGGASDSAVVTISNSGSGSLDWSTFTEPTAGMGTRNHDPALSEVLSVPDFVIDSFANGGTMQVFNVPAGIETIGSVVGFTFKGTVTGLTGSISWPGDMCMVLTAPTGETYTIGGLSSTGFTQCNGPSWGFPSTSTDGTYSATRDGIFDLVPDAGVWTIAFANDWNSASAATMSWSDVTVTLLKRIEPCSVNQVGWLSVSPSSGSTFNGAPTDTTVTVDTSGLLEGTHSAQICVSSNDTAGNEQIVVPVSVTVLGPEITVAPAAISSTLDIGQTSQHEITIGNIGPGELIWNAAEGTNGLNVDSLRGHFPDVPFTGAVRSPGPHSLHAAPIDELKLEKLRLSAEGPTSRAPGDVVPAYSTTGFSRVDYVTLDALVPGALSSIMDPGADLVFAGTFVNNDLSRQFFIATSGGDLPANAYGWIDTATGAVDQVGVLSGGVPAADTWTSAAWDPETGNVYAVSVSDAQVNQLWAIDPSDGTASLVGTISGGGLPAGPVVIAIAINEVGQLFALDLVDDVLAAVDKSNGAASVIGSLGVDANFAQDMDFDRSTGMLWWAGFSGTSGADASSTMFTIDTATGAATSVGGIQDDAEMLNFSVAVSTSGCAEISDVAWLSLDLTNGLIPGFGTDQVINATLDSTGLPVGVHQASVCISSNDVDRPLVEVPVTLTVQSPDAFIEVTPASLSSVVGIGLEDTQTLTIANLAYEDDLTWSIAEDTGAGDCSSTGDVTWLSVSDAGPTTTTPGDSAAVDVTFTGNQPDGVYTSALCITSDATESLVIVPVTMEVDETIGTPEIEVDPLTLSFDLPLDGSESADVTITNIGTGELIWSFGANPTEARAHFPGRSAQNTDKAAPAKVGRAPLRVIPFGEDLLAEGFEAGTIPPAGWEHVVTNPAFTWEIGTLNPHAGANTGQVLFNEDLVPQDEWLLSPEFALSEGQLTFWSLGSLHWCRDTFDNCDLNIWIVVGDIGGGDDILVGTADDDWAVTFEWAQSSFDLSPLLPGGPVRIGFQYVGSDGAQVGVDSISLTGEVASCEGSNVDWITVAPETGSALAGITDTATLTVDATGLPPGTYQADACVASNDATDPLVLIPVTLNVTSADPYLVVTPESLSSELGYETTEVQQLTIANLGQGELTWSIVEEPASVRGAATVLYDQTFDEGLEAVVSTEDTSSALFSSQAADDFTVPAGDTWNVSSVYVDGNYDFGGGPAVAVNVFIFADNSGSPGSTLHSFLDLAPTIEGGGHFQLDLPSTVQLAEGTYWLSVQPAMDFGDIGEWYWWTQASQSGAPAQWQEGGGYSTGCESWDSFASCGRTDADPDLMFQILGTVASGEDVCSAPADMPWVAVEPTAGDTAGNDTSLVDVTFSSVGMANGTYEGNLCLTSNAANAELVVIPLTLVVDETIGTPEIAVNPSPLVFNVDLGSGDSADLDIANIGSGRLDWTMGVNAPEVMNLDRPARVTRTLAGAGYRSTTTTAAPAEQRTRTVSLHGGDPLQVLVLSPDWELGGDGPQNLVDDLNAFADIDAEAFVGSVATVTPAALAAYDVVVLNNNNQWFEAGADEIVGDALADYVDAGGKVVLFSFALDNVGWELAGRFIDEDYAPLQMATADVSAAVSMNILLPDHPIANGAVSVGYDGLRQVHALQPGAELIAQWSDGQPLVAANDSVVAFNALYGATVSWTGDLDVLAHNAVVWLAGSASADCGAADSVAWLQVGTTSGQLLGGESQSSTISVDSTGMTPGTYQADLCVASNDDAKPVVLVPVTMTVATEVTVSPATIDDGTVGIAYGPVQLTADGPGTTQPFTFAVTDGALPDGLVLSAAGSLSGTPSAAGSFSFTVTATDSSASGFSGSQAYAMDVAQGMQAISFGALPPRSLDEGSFEVEATATSGLAVSFSSDTTGSCTVAGVEVTLVTTGLCTIRASQAGDANWLPAKDVTRSFVIQPGAVVEVVIGPDELPVGKVQQAYLANFTASGDGTTGPFSFSLNLGTLPMGLELSAEGELSGTPVEAGEFTFTVQATDSTRGEGEPNIGEREYTLEVLGEPIFKDGFEDLPIVKLAGDGAEILSVPLLDLLVDGEDGRLVTAAILVSAEGERVGLVQARCASDACEVRVLSKGLAGAWTQGDWWLVDDEPFQLQLFIEKSRVIDATRGRKD